MGRICRLLLGLFLACLLVNGFTPCQNVERAGPFVDAQGTPDSRHPDDRSGESSWCLVGHSVTNDSASLAVLRWHGGL